MGPVSFAIFLQPFLGFFKVGGITYLGFGADEIAVVYIVPGTSKKPPAEEEDEEEELRKLQAEMAM